jgi:hypothetical protein
MTTITKCMLAIAVLGALTSVAPVSALELSNQQRFSGTYPVYGHGAAGCIEDRGNGVLTECMSN